MARGGRTAPAPPWGPFLIACLLLMSGPGPAVQGIAQDPFNLPPDTDAGGNVQFLNRTGLFRAYFRGAERQMKQEWDTYVWPRIRHADFRFTLEIAPGGGRNTARLQKLVTRLIGVDLDAHAVELCRRRFAADSRLEFHVNDGQRLPMVPSGAITFIYSWDAMVHFHPEVIRGYVQEFGRVLAPNGTGFIHHSNLGAQPQYRLSSHIFNNPHWRSNMTCGLFAEYLRAAGLELTYQTPLTWRRSPGLDCISGFRKPASTG